MAAGVDLEEVRVARPEEVGGLTRADLELMAGNI